MLDSSTNNSTLAAWGLWVVGVAIAATVALGLLGPRYNGLVFVALCGGSMLYVRRKFFGIRQRDEVLAEVARQTDGVPHVRPLR